MEVIIYTCRFWDRDMEYFDFVVTYKCIYIYLYLSVLLGGNRGSILYKTTYICDIITDCN